MKRMLNVAESVNKQPTPTPHPSFAHLDDSKDSRRVVVAMERHGAERWGFKLELDERSKLGDDTGGRGGRAARELMYVCMYDRTHARTWTGGAAGGVL